MHGDLAGDARRQQHGFLEQVLDPVCDRDDRDAIGGNRAPHADALATSGHALDLRVQFRAGSYRHRQALRGAVGRVDTRIFRQGLLHGADHLQRDGCSGRDDAPDAIQAYVLTHTVITQHPDERGRAEDVADAELFDGLHQQLRVGFCRTRGIHVRHHGRHAERRVEEREGRKCGEVDLAGFDAEGFPQHLHLRGEMPVPIHDPLRNAGAAGGEQDCRHLAGPGGRHDRAARSSAQGQQLFRIDPPPTGARPGRDQPFDGVRRPAQDGAGDLGASYADECLRGSLGQALLQRLQADPGIDQHRHRAGLEQGEEQREEVQPRRRHQRGPDATADAVFLQAARVRIAEIFEFPVAGGAIP